MMATRQTLIDHAENNQNRRLAVAVSIGIVGSVYFLSRGPDPRIGTASSSGRAVVGGPFELVTHHGKPFTNTDVAGRPYLVFFGFTHCPDICPTTLGELSVLMVDLGADADKFTPLMITVDPERDTTEVLAD
jgi:protein SCO1